MGQTFHMNTLIMLWFSMVVTLLLAWMSAKNANIIPSKFQLVGEGMFSFTRSLSSASGPKADNYVFIIGSLFIFILFANYMGQLPIRLIDLSWFGLHGELMAATGDLNTTVGLALVTLVTYLVLSVKEIGMGNFVKHHMEPNIALLPIHLLDHITRPGSLAIRLYGNILVGEILTMIVLKIMPWGAPVFIIALEIFVATIQAFVFALLSAVYIGLMTSHHGDEH